MFDRDVLGLAPNEYVGGVTADGLLIVTQRASDCDALVGGAVPTTTSTSTWTSSGSGVDGEAVTVTTASPATPSVPDDSVAVATTVPGVSFGCFDGPPETTPTTSVSET
ncbi:MAG TPA: hypothetical protein PLV68_09040, partial [Ilumatobacteraceae bacterium]|nr:hypothetical protein [Ilumatobacteraceae bacterium]